MVLSYESRVKIIALTEEGHSVRQVAQRLDLSKSAVHRTVKRYRESGEYSRRPGSGRKRATSRADDRFVKMTSLRNRFLTAVDVRDRLQNVRGVVVSTETVRRRLKQAGLASRRPVKSPQLTREHRVRRLAFAERHLNWTVEQWGSVLFTDECRIGLYSSDDRIRVWRRPLERFTQCTTLESAPFHRQSLMVWGGINSEARTELIFIENGRLNAARYIEEVLQEAVVPFAPFIGEHFLLMHDNARPHAAGIVTQYLEEVGIAAMEWPARSADMNPIEHLWDQIKRRVRGRHNPPSTLEQLRTALIEEWDTFPQDKIRDLIGSMPRRVRALKNARGGNTSY